MGWFLRFFKLGHITLLYSVTNSLQQNATNLQPYTTLPHTCFSDLDDLHLFYVISWTIRAIAWIPITELVSTENWELCAISYFTVTRATRWYPRGIQKLVSTYDLPKLQNCLNFNLGGGNTLESELKNTQSAKIPGGNQCSVNDWLSPE